MLLASTWRFCKTPTPRQGLGRGVVVRKEYAADPPLDRCVCQRCTRITVAFQEEWAVSRPPLVRWSLRDWRRTSGFDQQRRLCRRGARCWVDS